MNRKEIEFSVREKELRRDVRVFGTLVGDVIREQSGDALYRRVEAVRRAAIERREGRRESDEKLHRLVQPLPAAEAEELVHSFSTYFQVVNLVETVHRIRRRRTYLRRKTGPQPGTLEATVRRLRRAGLDGEEMGALLRRILIEPVFTAHPTQAIRATILRKYQRIARKLVDRLDPSMTPPEDRASLETIRAEITTAWQTEKNPTERPTVFDELEHVLFYVTEVLYRIIPPFYEELEQALRGSFGPDAPAVPPAMLRFVSWVGGDMDGNPNVSAETIRFALARQRQLILGHYRPEILELSGLLTQSAPGIGFDGRMIERIDRYGGQFPEVMAAIPDRRRSMLYQVFLRLVAARLEETAAESSRGYDHADSFLDDLRLIETSLERNRGGRAGLFAVQRAIRRAETFGFHLVTLDVRQHARVHRAAAGRLLADDRWMHRTPEERTARLVEILATGAGPEAGLSAEDEPVLAVFRAIGESRARYGPRATGPYIVSMTQGVDDVLTVLVLARWSGLTDDQDNVPLDIAPLFETVTDLRQAPRIVSALLAADPYRAHLRARSHHQTVMVGYSDSNKDGGIAASRWAIQKLQRSLASVFDSAGVDFTVFHGRGGTISRGGGKTHRAVLTSPPGVVRGRLRLTEQGETINTKYGLRGIALRTLERSFGAVAVATALPVAPHPRWDPIMEEIAEESRSAYRALIEERSFHDYFRHATPIDVIERVSIGSRPPSRASAGAAGRIEDLRAIPWVFAWTQSRHVLPGWFGLGAGLEAAISRHGRKRLSRMVKEWRFAGTLIEDVEMVLAKADMPIAARYAELAGVGGRRTYEAVLAEYQRTVELILRIKGTKELLARDRTLRRSIRLRNPYVDPMSFLQIELLARWRDSGREDAALLRALRETVRGIAQGLQNTG